MTENRWIRLSDPADEVSLAKQESLKPVSVDLDGQIVSVRHWKDVSRRIVYWLIETGKLTETRLPVPFANYPHRTFVGSDPLRFHTRTERKKAEDLGNGMFLNTEAGALLLMDNCRLLLEWCGVSPEIVRVSWHRRL